jgi:cell division protein FtsA
MAGFRQLGREMLQLPVRVGAPNGLAGLSEEMRQPAYATTVGLLLWALRFGRSVSPEKTHPQAPPLMDRIVQWLRNLLPE